MKILFSVGNAFVPIYQNMVKKMENLGADVTCLMFEEAMKKDIVKERIREVDIYIVAVAKVDRELMDWARSLKLILKLGTGVDNIDVDYAKQKGIIVSNAPGQNAWSVAELTIGFMIGLSRKIPLMDAKTKQGSWKHHIGSELYKKTLGIVGFGNIGKKVAQCASSFNMRKIVFTHYKDETVAKALNVKFVEFEQLAAESDYLVVSTSMKPSNYHLIDSSTLNKMKPSAFLINVSRGALIDEQALFKALRSKKIAGAALDVRESEPAKGAPNLDNLIVTPHIGGSTLESTQRIAQVTIENIRRFLNNQPLNHVIHP